MEEVWPVAWPFAATFRGLSLTFAPHPPEDAVVYKHSAAGLFLSLWHRTTAAAEGLICITRLDFPVKPHQDNSCQCEHSDLCANCLASSHTEIPASEKLTHKFDLAGYHKKFVCVCVCDTSMWNDGKEVLLCFPFFSRTPEFDVRHQTSSTSHKPLKQQLLYHS